MLRCRTIEKRDFVVAYSAVTDVVALTSRRRLSRRNYLIIGLLFLLMVLYVCLIFSYVLWRRGAWAHAAGVWTVLSGQLAAIASGGGVFLILAGCVQFDTRRLAKATIWDAAWQATIDAAQRAEAANEANSMLLASLSH